MLFRLERSVTFAVCVLFISAHAREYPYAKIPAVTINRYSDDLMLTEVELKFNLDDLTYIFYFRDNGIAFEAN